MSTQHIAALIETMPFEPVPSSPFQYDEEVITACEQLLGASFPADFRWYLAHVGWRRIQFGKRSLLVMKGDYLCHLEFQEVAHKAFAIHNIHNYAWQPGYFPFGTLNGEINPAIDGRLYISVNAGEPGSIWLQLPADKYMESQTVKLADSFTAFLQLIQSADAQRPIAAAHNRALFNRLKADYEASGEYTPTRAGTPHTLLQLFFDQQDHFIIDSVQNIVFQLADSGTRVECAQAFQDRARAYAAAAMNRYWFPARLERTALNMDEAKVYRDNFYLLAVNSTVGQGVQLAETFLLYKETASGQWSLLRRYEAVIPDLKIKGLGTFSFDSTYKWQLKTRVQPAWSELKAVLAVDGEEDALTATKIEFIREIIANVDFKPVLEAAIAQMMELEAGSNVWEKLGKKLSVNVRDNDHFSIHADTEWDPEHGITLHVKQWQII